MDNNFVSRVKRANKGGTSFIQFPKRRKRFFGRFIRTGATQYILGNKKTLFGSIKAKLKENKNPNHRKRRGIFNVMIPHQMRK